MNKTAAPLRCLVVDDHEALRVGLVARLEAEDDIEVVGQADDGDSALALIERRRPQVAVVDVHLPGLDGIEICRRLNEREAEVAVLLYTADRDPSVVEDGLAAGARGFLLKMSPLGDVVRAVRAVAAGGTYIESTIVTALLEHRQEAEAPVLSVRETQVLQLLADGQTTEATARSLFLSPATVRSYLESAMQKLTSRNRTHAVADAVRRGYIN